MKFTTKSKPLKSFTHASTPDTGASISMIANDIMEKEGVPLTSRRRERIQAANGEMMECSGTVNLIGEKMTSGRDKAEIPFKVSKDLTEEVLIGYKDLRRLKVIPANFPLEACKKLAAPPMNNVPRLEEAETQKEGDTTEDEAEVDQPATEEQKETDRECATMRDRMLKKFATTVSDDLPRRPMKGPAREITLKPGEHKKIVCTRARPVQLHLQAAAWKLIQDLEEATITTRELEVTPMISPAMFIAKSNGQDVRLVVDYRELNKQIQRPVHPFMSAADTIRQIGPTAKFFATLDAVSGYFQIRLTEKSAKLTTFLAPWGKWRFNRSPMGCCASQDWWNAESDKVVEEFQEWCAKIVDDIIIWASSLEELQTRMELVLEKCKEMDITISKKKMAVGNKVIFAGYEVSDSGIRPDRQKVKCLRDFPAPTDVTSLRSFLGLAQQLGAFLPDLSQATDKLRSLLLKDTEYLWTPEIDLQFVKAKKILTSPLLVKPFDPRLTTCLLTDASKLHGLGYILLQYEDEDRKQSRVVQCGSFALTPAQKNYAIIELEMLAIVRAIQKCDFYLLGMEHFEVLTDHKPLLGIVEKPLNEVYNSRLSKMKQHIMQYVFSVTHVPGKIHYAADALSRYPVFEGYNEDGEGIHAVVKRVQEDPRVVRMAERANNDDEYSTVIDALAGDKHSLPPRHPAREYSNKWDEITTLVTSKGRLLMLGDRIIVPRTLRKEVLAQLHRAHQGITKTRLAATDSYYWVGMANDVKQVVEACEACRRFLPSQSAEPEKGYTQELERPLQLISADLYYCI